MALREVHDADGIRDALAAAVAHDPVRGTVFGTLGRRLEDSAWAVTDGARLGVRSSAGFPVVLGGDWSEAQRAELVGRLAALPALAGLAGDPQLVLALVTQLPGVRVRRRFDERLYRLDELAVPFGVAGSARTADDGDLALLADWLERFGADTGMTGRGEPAAAAERLLREGGAWLWVDGDTVSLANRQPSAGGSARIGPVYTPRQCRGRGYGSAVTAAATRDILDEGAIPVLFTDLANPVSNRIYQQLGYRPVADRVEVTFEVS